MLLAAGMKRRLFNLAAAVSLVIMLATVLRVASAQGAPGDDAADAFRKYVAALRAGSVDDVLKLVEPVPDSSKPLLRACVESAVAVEKIKTEMTRQMGPPKRDEDGWNLGQQSDEVLKTMHGIPEGDIVKLVAKDPADPKAEFDVGLAVRAEGRWVVAAATAIGIDPPSKFIEPPPDERARLLKLADATTSAAKAVLARLQKKEFKSPGEVNDALVQELTRAGGK
jgi:hypothetical protein